MVRTARAKDVRSDQASEVRAPSAPPEAPWVYAIEMEVDKVLTYMKPDLDFADCYDGKIVRRQIGLELGIEGDYLNERPG